MTRKLLLTTTALLPLIILTACPPNLTGLPDGIDQDIFSSDPADPSDPNVGGGSGTTFGDIVLSGRILPYSPPGSQATNDKHCVFVVSDTTGAVYEVNTDADGDFALDLPNSEAGSVFTITIGDMAGHAVGPVLFDANGRTGIKPTGPTDLGDVQLPADPHAAPIMPASNATTAEIISPGLQTRLNHAGVPVGLAGVGKGPDAVLNSNNPFGKADRDRDGLIDLFDADDDGDGTVDDFDSSDTSTTGGVRVNFFMNLKIAAENANTYYTGSPADIAARLATDTIITFEVLDDDAADGVAIADVTMYASPGPTYLATAELMTDGGGGLTFAPWADTAYAFAAASDRFQAFVRPNAGMQAGDTFRIRVTFADGTSFSTWRMINFVFKNIPKLIKYGSPIGMTPFDITNDSINGSPDKPIRFQADRDLVLEFEPPVDESGDPLTDLPYYDFQVFYHAADGTQLNGDIDVDATFGPLPAGATGNLAYVVDASDLTLAADGTYTVTLPKALFPATVKDRDGAVHAVEYFKIDLTAESDGGNAAVMLSFKPY